MLITYIVHMYSTKYSNLHHFLYFVFVVSSRRIEKFRGREKLLYK